MKKSLLLLFVLLSSFVLYSQNTEYAGGTFADTRVINGQSSEMSVQGQLKFIISHRFGDIYQNNAYSVLYNFLGFSEGATMRIGLDYGIFNWFEAGGGWNSSDKTYDGFVKFRVLRQSTGAKNFPFTVDFYSDMAVITDTLNTLIHPYFTDGFSFANQVIIARKFNDFFSFQLAPTQVHRNLVDLASDKNDVFAIGAAARFQVTSNMAITGEYYFTLPNQLSAGYDNSTAVGIDIATKGHVFQLQLTNSPYLIPEYFIPRTQGNIFGKDANGNFDLNLRFGFNITRTFKVAGRQY